MASPILYQGPPPAPFDFGDGGNEFAKHMLTVFFPLPDDGDTGNVRLRNGDRVEPRPGGHSPAARYVRSIEDHRQLAADIFTRLSEPREWPWTLLPCFCRTEVPAASIHWRWGVPTTAIFVLPNCA